MGTRSLLASRATRTEHAIGGFAGRLWDLVGGIFGVVGFVGLIGLVAPAQATTEEAIPADARVRVAASDRYVAGRTHRFLLGGGYRDLWQSEIELPVLDLRDVAGGLEPVGRFGGLQTAVLGFIGRDGRRFTFRGTDKDPSAVLDPVFYDTIVQAIVQDQMAAQHPGGPIAAAILTRAAGVLTLSETMVVMPDDPLLGEYREEFAGMVGTFFEYPQPSQDGRPGFADALEIIGYKDLYERLERGNQTDVDVQAFLRARLLDLLIGDFDRHRKQWRWARLPGKERWQPIPEDRDQAFVRYDGAAQRVMKIYIPILQNYGEDYPFIKGLTLHGWEQDRWLLPHLEWMEWEPIVRDIQARLTDETIEAAVDALPPEYAALDGERFRRDVKGRRDRLNEAARAFYEQLAKKVVVETSNAADDVMIMRHDDDTMTVTVQSGPETPDAGRVVFERRFFASETAEVTIRLRGGNDQVRIEGGRGPILLRVVAGGGEKRVDDSAGGGTRIYDTAHEVEVVPGPGTCVDDKPYEPPPSDSGFVDVEGVPPREWGSDTIPVPEFGFQPDVGVFLGAAVSHTRYGFRKHPWASKHSFGAGWAFEANAPRVRYKGEFRPENSTLLGSVDLQYSGIEVLRFYGFGNDTPDRGNDRFFRARNQQYRMMFALAAPLFHEAITVSGGPYAKVSRTSKGARLIDQVHPYGNNDFAVFGGQINLKIDTRRSIDTSLEHLELPFSDNPAAGYPTSGFLFDVTGTFHPAVLDAEEPYGAIHGSISGYYSLGEDARVTLGLRVGGMETFGRTPYFDVATIGGGRFFSGSPTDRGYAPRRFAGDSSVFGNADLRVVLGRIKIIVPGDVGVHFFGDVGRVFINDESSDDWHPSGGGGIWFSPLVRTNTISLSAAAGTEDTLFYLRFGFHY